MATSVVPALIDALIATATEALSDTIVSDGFGVTDDPGNFLMIGVEDPDSEQAAFSADTKQEWATADRAGTRNEIGEILCAAVAWNGDADMKAARDAVYAITAALEVALRTTPALGLDGLLWTSFGTSTQFSQAQGETGAAAMLVFRIAFQARI